MPGAGNQRWMSGDRVALPETRCGSSAEQVADLGQDEPVGQRRVRARSSRRVVVTRAGPRTPVCPTRMPSRTALPDPAPRRSHDLARGPSEDPRGPARKSAGSRQVVHDPSTRPSTAEADPTAAGPRAHLAEGVRQRQPQALEVVRAGGDRAKGGRSADVGPAPMGEARRPSGTGLCPEVYIRSRAARALTFVTPSVMAGVVHEARGPERREVVEAHHRGRRPAAPSKVTMRVTSGTLVTLREELRQRVSSWAKTIREPPSVRMYPRPRCASRA